MEQLSFFDREVPQPLAARLRPNDLSEYAGQKHLLGPGKVLRRLIEQCTSKKSLLYDKKGEEHYNLISALHKSMWNSEPVPLVIRNAVTGLMKELSYGEGYQYAHDTEEKLTNMQCLPDSLVGRSYYQPTDQGQEGKFRTRLEQIKEWKMGKK